MNFNKQAVTDPQLAALKKIRKMQRKKEAKKRKIKTGSKTSASKSKKIKLTEPDDY